MVKFVFGLIIGLICVIFFFQNGDMSQINFLNWTLALPQYLIMMIFFVSGIFLGWLLTSLVSLKKRKRKKSADRP
ncbi:putative integral membrane protein [Spirochaeta isovalerica]|uniref:Putative integral membrane protein n=2 Tax=Spirochaeta isovalerica TaxID=150 RepID=A0A841R6I0_9SPIO|nr:putative integral membrane protein [Spirochaeta isovalerica]